MEGSSQIGQSLASVEMVLTTACLSSAAAGLASLVPASRLCVLAGDCPVGVSSWELALASSDLLKGPKLEALHQSVQAPVGEGSLECQ